MSLGYKVATGLVMLLFGWVAYSAYTGAGLTSDAEVMARNRSVRGGSLHNRHFYGGGPGFGK